MPDRTDWLSFAHPLLFALLPIVSLLAHNISDAPPIHALRPALLAVLGAAFLLIILRRIIKDTQTASLVATIILMLFFSYGHIYLGYLDENTLGVFNQLGLVGRPTYLAIVWILFFAGAAFVVYRAGKLRRIIAQAFTVMAMAAIVVPLGQIVSYEIQLSKPWSEEQTHFSYEAESENQTPPDIYLLVLDAYGRADILQDIFSFDNSAFLSRLESLGFHVADQSRSNYTQTGLSMASMLNMTYLDSLSPSLPADSASRDAMGRLVRWSELRRFLEENGYTIVGMPTGYRVTELENAEIFLREPLGAATTMERLAFESSALIMLQDVAQALGRSPLLPGYRAHRDRIEFVLEELNEVHSIPGPKFILIHLLIPHPPFVFDVMGNPVPQTYPFTLLDGDAFPGTREDYLRGYRDQITYVNRVVEEAVINLLQSSERPPVIVIHGDHGPGSRLQWQSAEGTDLLERTAILSAYYLPGAPKGVVHDSITPVNTFRLVLDLYFAADLGLLPDESFFSTWDQPYSFTMISN
ncbi:MAG: hypothetical protein ACE5JF_04835 [Anaerolineales bacterium]